MLAVGLFGCAVDPHPYPISQTRVAASAQYSRIDIDQSDVEDGLHALLLQFSRDHGVVASDPIVKDYAPVVKNALYRTGYCSIQKLQINNVMMDIDVYFRTDLDMPALFIEAYLSGSAAPSYRIMNQYYMTASHELRAINTNSQDTHNMPGRL